MCYFLQEVTLKTMCSAKAVFYVLIILRPQYMCRLYCGCASLVRKTLKKTRHYTDVQVYLNLVSCTAPTLGVSLLATPLLLSRREQFGSCEVKVFLLQSSRRKASKEKRGREKVTSISCVRPLASFPSELSCHIITLGCWDVIGSRERRGERYYTLEPERRMAKADSLIVGLCADDEM